MVFYRLKNRLDDIVFEYYGYLTLEIFYVK